MISNKGKCYKCTERYVGCHCTCPYYLEYKKRLDVIKDRKKKYNDLFKPIKRR